jgi:hypothetical protein
MERRIKDKEAELIKLKKKVKAQKQLEAEEDLDFLDQETDTAGPDEEHFEEDVESKTDALVRTLEGASGKRLLICIKGYPDPDNIATSLALSYMAAQFDVQSTIVHFEQISHHENRALVKKLD